MVKSGPTTIKIDEIEYVRKDSIPIIHYKAGKNGPWEIGQSYLIRTVTMIQHGVLVDVTDKELVLTECSWIADTGRFSDFVNGKISPVEVEPFPSGVVIVNRGALIDACQVPGKFLTQK
jgi:hypothetical protein